jgi:hypothetical protein
MQLDLWAGYAELIADGSRRCLLNFAMPRNGGASAIFRIAMDRMVGSFPIQKTSILLQMSNKIAAFHAAGTSTVSFSQMALPGASLAAFSR